MIAKFIPPPNDQRSDIKWENEGVNILPNSQCLGNFAEDVMRSVSLETGISTLYPANTYEYYHIFLANFRSMFKRFPSRIEYLTVDIHCKIQNEIYKSNGLEHKLKWLETKSLYNLEKRMVTNQRIAGASVNIPGSTHWIRFNKILENGFEVNDPFGEYPYDKKKIGGVYIYEKELLQKIGINRIAWIEV